MRYEVMTKLSPQEATQQALQHFGPKGVGLEIVDQNAECLVFQGGGGHVAVTACASDTDKAKTRVEIETREWDYAVRQFMARVN